MQDFVFIVLTSTRFSFILTFHENILTNSVSPRCPSHLAQMLLMHPHWQKRTYIADRHMGAGKEWCMGCHSRLALFLCDLPAHRDCGSSRADVLSPGQTLSAQANKNHNNRKHVRWRVRVQESHLKPHSKTPSKHISLFFYVLRITMALCYQNKHLLCPCFIKHIKEHLLDSGSFFFSWVAQPWLFFGVDLKVILAL